MQFAHTAQQKINCSDSFVLLLIVCLFVRQNLHKQLEEAIQDGEIWVMQLKDTEYELEGSRERVQQQATEILHKASKTNPPPPDPLRLFFVF